MAKHTKFEVVVIGGGPGGYVSAIRAAQLSAKVALVEKNLLGGVCTNVGCMPTKTMLHAAEFIRKLRNAKEFGVAVSSFRVDFPQFVRHRDSVIEKLRDGIAYLLEHNNVKVIQGEARLESKTRVKVSGDKAQQTLETRSVIIAAGSRPFRPPIPGIDGANILTGEETAVVKKLPASVFIAGGGAEGAEFASLFSALGSQVVIAEMMPELLPLEDRDLGVRLRQVFRKQGIKVLTSAKVESIQDHAGRKKTAVLKDQVREEYESDLIVLGLGRRVDTRRIGVDAVGVQLNKGRVVVNDRMETTVPGVYAIGDATGGAFAHEAMEQGIVAAENAVGRDSKYDGTVMPRVTYTIPEVAAVGLTEDEAKKKGIKFRVGKFPFSASGRAATMDEADGLVKILVNAENGTILGVHMIGHNVSELIAEASLAIRCQLSADTLISTIHPHPTLSEIFREAILDCYERSVHKVRV